jgi:exosortase A-associated hydrolase 2
VELRAEFIAAERGRIFVLARRPAAMTSAAVLMVPPFAEEMNKSRKMMAELALKLADRGVPSICVDLFGTGDSDGEFRDATWPRWSADLQTAMQWADHAGMRVSKILGARLGCSLAIELIRQSTASFERIVFWQPVLDGKRFIEQFLRLRIAARMMENDRKETVADLRGRLAQGETIEVAGYELNSELVTAIERASTEALLNIAPCNLDWIEVVRAAGAAVSTPTAKTIETIRAKGFSAQLHCVVSEPFWSSTEIVTCAELIDKSVGVLSEAA